MLKEIHTVLFFRHDEVVFMFEDKASNARHWFNPIRYYLSYKTFVDYNLIGVATDHPLWDDFDKVDCVRFRINRLIQVETEIEMAGQPVKAMYHEGKDHWIELTTSNLIDYIRILNPSLYYALAAYLIGCDNPRHFLVEFYKAYEAIRNAFGSEEKLVSDLRANGINKNDLKTFTKLCNDNRKLHWTFVGMPPCRMLRCIPSIFATSWPTHAREIHLKLQQLCAGNL